MPTSLGRAATSATRLVATFETLDIRTRKPRAKFAESRNTGQHPATRRDSTRLEPRSWPLANERAES